LFYREEMLYELLGLVDENAVNQWITKNGWKPNETGYILISNQEENIKTKKITEKIDLESVAGIIASSF
jgi:translation initiation factor 3 subunit K